MTVHVLYNPVDEKNILDQAKKDCDEVFFASGVPVILAIGRLTKTKNYPFLIEAFSLLNNKMPCKLLVLGEGDKKDELQTLINEKSLSEDVKLLGFKKNPFSYIARCHLVTLTSKNEGYPNVLIQANVLQKKAVALESCGGVRELIPNDCISPVGDVQAFADLMYHQLSNNSPFDNCMKNYQSNRSFVTALKHILQQSVTVQKPA